MIPEFRFLTTRRDLTGTLMLVFGLDFQHDDENHNVDVYNRLLQGEK